MGALRCLPFCCDKCAINGNSLACVSGSLDNGSGTIPGRLHGIVLTMPVDAIGNLPCAGLIGRQYLLFRQDDGITYKRSPFMPDGIAVTLKLQIPIAVFRNGCPAYAIASINITQGNKFIEILFQDIATLNCDPPPLDTPSGFFCEQGFLNVFACIRCRGVVTIKTNCGTYCPGQLSFTGVPLFQPPFVSACPISERAFIAAAMPGKLRVTGSGFVGPCAGLNTFRDVTFQSGQVLDGQVFRSEWRGPDAFVLVQPPSTIQIGTIQEPCGCPVDPFGGFAVLRGNVKVNDTDSFGFIYPCGFGGKDPANSTWPFMVAAPFPGGGGIGAGAGGGPCNLNTARVLIEEL
jgi:hypothetical protein